MIYFFPLQPDHKTVRE
jgi:hypothetical protein